MTKQEIIQQLEHAWGEIPGWMNGWSRESLEKYLQRLGWVVDGNSLSVQTDPEKVAKAEQLTSASFGREIHLIPVEVAGAGTGRAHIIRMLTSSDDPAVPTSLIIKVVNDDYPHVSNKAELFRTFFNEYATYEFFRQLELAEPIIPQFYGGDTEMGVMVLEDLGKVESAYKANFGSDALHAEQMLVGWMETIGKMHAFTIGQEDMFRGIRSALGPLQPVENQKSQANRVVENFRETSTLAGIEVRGSCVEEIKRVMLTITNPGPFAALSKVDNTPGDCVMAGSKLKILDFEHCRFQHALLDAAILRMIYPTAWRTEYLTPESIVKRTEAAYRKQLVEGCPEAEDEDTFAEAFVSAVAYWCLRAEGQFSSEFLSELMEKDTGWSGRQRVVQRLKVLAKTTEEWGQFPAIGATARELESKLRNLWPEVEDMAYYPAFLNGQNST